MTVVNQTRCFANICCFDRISGFGFGLLICYSALLPSAQGETFRARMDQVTLEWSQTDQQLVYRVQFGGREVIEQSVLGITIDDQTLGTQDAFTDNVSSARQQETFATRGQAASASVRYVEHKQSVRHLPSDMPWQIEFRVYDNAVAWRYVIDGRGTRKISSEHTDWRLPAGSRVWFFERLNDWKLKSYAGTWINAPVEQMDRVSDTRRELDRDVQGKPLVVELPDQGGYALLCEAGLFNFSGLRFEAVGDRRFVANFTEGAAGFTVTGRVVTPWRVVLLADSLQGLIDAGHVIEHLAGVPDAKLFADSDRWIRPGRSVWRWFMHKIGTPEQERAYVDHASALGFEYSLIDEGWEGKHDGWDQPFGQLREMTAYAEQRDVGVWVWKRSSEVADPADEYAVLRDWLARVADAGAVGIKVDFFNSEDKVTIDLMEAILRESAKRRLMVNFHGNAASTGEWRRYPNELTREGIRGIELNNMKEGPLTASHNAALPFTRFVVGPGDYTPLSYSRPGPTSWAHQLAMVVLSLSPFQCIAEHPPVLMQADTAAGLEVLKAMPATWDETRVLPPSRIGELAAIARRSGNDWFIGVVRGDEGAGEVEHLTLDMLSPGVVYRMERIHSPKPASLAKQTQSVRAGDRVNLPQPAGSGLVLWLRQVDD